MSRIVVPIVVILSVLAVPQSAAAKWTRLTSDHFLFVGDAPERDMRAIAVRLEQFRDIVGQVVAGDVTHSPIPTVVVVFQDDRSFTPFKPMFQGRPVSLAGYFIGMEDVNYIAVNAEQEAMAYGLIFHEYTHFLTGNAVGLVPVWVNEGLAELYQTFTVSNGGRNASIGVPSRQNLELLQKTTNLMRVADLIKVAHDSPLYNEGDRRSLFYAESWALVHYLTFGSQARSGQLKKYLDAIGIGVSPDEAFTQAFGDPGALDEELQRYVRSFAFSVLRLEFDEKTAVGSASRAQVLSDGDAAGYLGDLMARQRPAEGRVFLKKTLETTPDAPRALVALGLLELREQNNAAAFPLLEKAAALAPGDAGVQSAYGRALTTRADKGATDDEQLYIKARTVLTRALEIEPDNVSTIVTLAEVEMASGANPPRAVELMERVVKASPGREEYRLMLAQAFAVNGEYKRASDSLGVLMARGSRPEIRDAARRMLARIADARNAVGAALSADATASVEPSADEVMPTQSQPDGPPRETMQQGAFVPTLRPIQAGEVRAAGRFSAVECRAGIIVLQIDTDAGPLRLAVKQFDEMEFLTYRQDSPSSVPCGAQRPVFPVLATYRTDLPLAGANTPNRAIAIELLPDGFTVK
jgi:cytochrome c-type biogenesis protein CcmH/NrfG